MYKITFFAQLNSLIKFKVLQTTMNFLYNTIFIHHMIIYAIISKVDLIYVNVYIFYDPKIVERNVI